VRVLVTGAGGQLGRDLARALAAHDTILFDQEEMDVTDPAVVRDGMRASKPDAVIHAAAWTDVDACETDPARAHLVNAEGARLVAQEARTVGAFAVFLSTDYVFDGMLRRAYVEDDEAHPIQVYGRTKHEGEIAAAATGARVAVVRTAWLYGAAMASGAPARNFVRAILIAARRGPVTVVDDQVGSPTWSGDLARALTTLVENPQPGTFHVVNTGAVSRYELARAVVEGAGMDPDLVRPVSTAHGPARPAARPAYAPLDGPAWRAAGFAPLPPWDDALARALPGILAVEP
jgi:dTDP-4-dehydrorhamnose reductase